MGGQLAEQLWSGRSEEPQAVVYPDSDGEPMGETELHVMAIFHLLGALRILFDDRQDVYVIADMFVYYEEGNPKARKAPDVMVVKGVDRCVRRIFKTWEEKAVPSVIFEVTSKSTWLEDLARKTSVYSRLGVKEYYLFDPLREYIESGFLAFRLEEGEYLEVPVESDGGVSSPELGAYLRPEGPLLRVIDPVTSQPFPDFRETNEQISALGRRIEQEAQRAEQEAQRAEQEAQRAEQEAQRAEQEAQRAETAEEEVRRLKELLEQIQTGRGGSSNEQGS